MSDFDLYILKIYIYSLAGVMYSDPMGPSFAVWKRVDTLLILGPESRTQIWGFL
jgi:hypothetical protein